MTFLNNKEDILHIELTDYGKEKFINGKFSPYYYSFSDRDIVYSGVEKYVGDLAGKNRRISHTPRILCYKNNSSTLGNSEPSNKHKPSFNIKVIKGNIVDQVTRTLTEDFSNNTFTVTIEAEDFYNFDTDSLEFSSSILLEITEENSLFQKHNFDIEVFRIQKTDLNFPLVHTLEFLSNRSVEFSSAFFSEEEEEITFHEDMPVVNPSVVEYFLNISVDKEILSSYAYDNNLNIDELNLNIDEEIINC